MEKMLDIGAECQVIMVTGILILVLILGDMGFGIGLTGCRLRFHFWGDMM